MAVPTPHHRDYETAEADIVVFRRRKLHTRAQGETGSDQDGDMNSGEH